MPLALVTGASGGIGRAIRKTLEQRGYEVLGLDLTEGPEAADRHFVLDLAALAADPASQEATLARIEKFTQSGLHLLVNNAAAQVVKSFERITIGDWNRTMAVNVTAPFLLIQRFLPALERVKGSVVNISSIHANLTKPGFAAYAASKGALTTLTRSLAVELGPRGVRVNAVLPAAIDTPMLREAFEGNEEGLAKLGEHHPIGRIGRPEEIAGVVAFVGSPEAGFLNGAAIEVNGGIGARLHDPA